MYTRKLIQLLITFGLLAGFSVNPGPSAFAQNCPEVFNKLSPPLIEGDVPHTELCSHGFALSYSHLTKTPAWVVERLQADTLSGPAKRKFSTFKSDPRLTSESQAGLVDYRGSGYDRGHMAPAGDLKSDQAAMDESFYLSNIAPQVGVGFNRGIWRKLEEKVRVWVRARGELYVITGPVFYDYIPVIGKSKVVVPDAFFKIIYDLESFETLAFLLPNRALPDARLIDFQTTIDALESKTGIDFFSELNPALEAALELTSRPFWPLLNFNFFAFPVFICQVFERI
ncbi:MAG: DNA/RNA non-specific endonuclease [Alphaproteobacteria bacterium]